MNVEVIETPERAFLSCAETAKLLRAELKQTFPGVKFSVRSSTYSGGASIDVGWTDGPSDAEVSRIAQCYGGARFDGMIDMATYVQHWLEDDGTVTLAHDGGTDRSRGSRSECFGSRRTPGARLVHLGADYVFTNRKLSDELVEYCAGLVQPNGTFSSTRAERCDGCGNWPSPEAACYVVEVDDGLRRTLLVCSPTCGGRLIARYRSEVAA